VLRLFPLRCAILAALVGTAGCDLFTDSDPEPVTLTVVSWGGSYEQAMEQAWYRPYMEENPHITLVQDGPTNYGQLEAMVRSGNTTWDVVDIENDFGLKRNEPVLVPIDCSKVPCADLQPDRYQTTGFRVPVMLWGMVMAYRTDVWGAGVEPAGWEGFFDLERFPGKRAVRRSGPASGILEAALIADGVPRSALYPLDVERALRKLDVLRGHIEWWDVGGECADLIARKAVAMAACPNGRIFDVQKVGQPIRIQWNGALIAADYMVVPVGSKQVDAAMDFIAWVTSPRNNARLSDYISYGPANAKAGSFVAENMRPHLASTYSDITIARDDTWLDANFATVSARFDAWRAEGAGIQAP